MGNIIENKEDNYNWENESVYLIEEDDHVNGGEDGVSNRQAKQLTRRTRDLFNRIADLLKRVISGDHDTLSSAKNYTDISTSNTATTTLKSAKDYTDIKVSSLVDSSPETLNTLNELASALGDDPNFATTVATQIGNKVDKTDPRLTDNRPADGGTSNYAKRLMTDLDITIGATFDGTSKWKLDANHSLYKGVSVSHADTSSNTDKVGGYSANDLFINKGADDSDINNLPAYSGMWAVNHDSGGVNLPFPYGAVVQFAGAFGSGGAPILQMASRFNGNHFYVRSKWYTETLASNGWKELYHSGNFDPSNKFGFISNSLNSDNATHGSGYCYGRDGHPTTGGTIVTFNGLGVGNPYGTLQLMCDNQTVNNARFWLRNNNQQGFTSWKELYHSGNFDPETKADSSDVMKVLRAGKVNADGSMSKYKGYLLPGPNPDANYHKYTIYHNIGDTNYMTLCTVTGQERALEISVLQETSTYIEVIISSYYSGVTKSPFNFTIFEI